MHPELKQKLVDFLGAVPAGATGASLTWDVDGTCFSISIAMHGGSATISASAYKPIVTPDPTPIMLVADPAAVTP